MEKKTISPRKVIEVGGRLAYGEGFQSWNTIRLKKEFINEFPQLKEKRAAFSYKLVFHREYKDLMQNLKKLGLQSGNMPILMWVYREDSE